MPETGDGDGKGGKEGFREAEISIYLIAYKHTAEVGINFRFFVILVQIKPMYVCALHI